MHNINLVQIIGYVIYDQGVIRNHNDSYEIVVPFLTICRNKVFSDRKGYKVDYDIMIPSTSGIIDKSTDDGKIIYTGNVLGNKYTILGDFYNFKGNKDSVSEVREYYNTFTRVIAHLYDKRLRTTFSIYYKKEDTNETDIS